MRYIRTKDGSIMKIRNQTNVGYEKGISEVHNKTGIVASYANATDVHLINYLFSIASRIVNSSNFNSKGRDERLYGICMCLATINIYNTLEKQIDGTRNWYFKNSESIFEIAQAIYDGFLAKDLGKLKEMMMIDYELVDYFNPTNKLTLVMKEELENARNTND